MKYNIQNSKDLEEPIPTLEYLTDIENIAREGLDIIDYLLYAFGLQLLEDNFQDLDTSRLDEFSKDLSYITDYELLFNLFRSPFDPNFRGRFVLEPLLIIGIRNLFELPNLLDFFNILRNIFFNNNQIYIKNKDKIDEKIKEKNTSSEKVIEIMYNLKIISKEDYEMVSFSYKIINIIVLILDIAIQKLEKNLKENKGFKERVSKNLDSLKNTNGKVDASGDPIQNNQELNLVYKGLKNIIPLIKGFEKEEKYQFNLEDLNLVDNILYKYLKDIKKEKLTQAQLQSIIRITQKQLQDYVENAFTQYQGYFIKGVTMLFDILNSPFSSKLIDMISVENVFKIQEIRRKYNDKSI